MNLLQAAELKRELDARRATGAAPLVMLFGTGLVVMAGAAAYEGMQQCVALGWPVLPLLLAGAVGWPIAGLLRQGRLAGDREWNAFVRQMPLGPAHLLAVHLYRAAAPTLSAALVLACAAAGGGGTLLTLQAWGFWLTMTAGLAWTLAVQLLATMVVSRLPGGRAVLAAAATLWVLQLAARALWGPVDAFGHDPVLATLGAVPLARALRAADTMTWQEALATAAHLAGVAAALGAVAWRLALRPTLTRGGGSLAVAMTRPAGRLLARLLPGPLGAQVAVEWLRTLRGPSAALGLYALAALAAVLALRACDQAAGGLIALLVLVCFAMVESAAPQILRDRPGGALYDILGVEPRHYVLAFATSVGIPAALLCILLVPVMSAGSPDWTLIARVVAACAATGVSVVPVVVGVDHFITRFQRNRAMGTVARMLALAQAGLLAAVVPVYLFLVSTLHVSLPLLFGGFFLYVEVRQCSHRWVRRAYWRLGDD